VGARKEKSNDGLAAAVTTYHKNHIASRYTILSMSAGDEGQVEKDEVEDADELPPCTSPLLVRDELVYSVDVNLAPAFVAQIRAAEMPL